MKKNQNKELVIKEQDVVLNKNITKKPKVFKTHFCRIDNSILSIEKGSCCNWCDFKA